MNYLQLVNDFISEAGIGDPLGSLSDLTDEELQAKNWISKVWLDIQKAKRWNFRWAEDSFTTEVGKDVYTLSNINRSLGDEINIDSFTIPGSPENKAQEIIERPDKSLKLSPTPTVSYVINYEYYKEPQVLTLEADVPAGIPSDLHTIIVWGALMHYARGNGREDRDVLVEAKRNYSVDYQSLVNKYAT